MSEMEKTYFTTADFKKLTSNTLDAKITYEKIKTEATKEEIKTLATMAELTDVFLSSV